MFPPDFTRVFQFDFTRMGDTLRKKYLYSLLNQKYDSVIHLIKSNEFSSINFMRITHFMKKSLFFSFFIFERFHSKIGIFGLLLFFDSNISIITKKKSILNSNDNVIIGMKSETFIFKIKEEVKLITLLFNVVQPLFLISINFHLNQK